MHSFVTTINVASISQVNQFTLITGQYSGGEALIFYNDRLTVFSWYKNSQSIILSQIYKPYNNCQPNNVHT